MIHNAALYIRRDGARAVVVPVHRNQDGIWCEDDSPVVIEGALDPERLGHEAQVAASGTRRIESDLRTMKRTDWGAYRGSGAKSVREFEDQFIRMWIRAENDSNLIYEVGGLPSPNYDLSVRAGISRYSEPSELGAVVIRVYEACRDKTL